MFLFQDTAGSAPWVNPQLSRFVKVIPVPPWKGPQDARDGGSGGVGSLSRSCRLLPIALAVLPESEKRGGGGRREEGRESAPPCPGKVLPSLGWRTSLLWDSPMGSSETSDLVVITPSILYLAERPLVGLTDFSHCPQRHPCRPPSCEWARVPSSLQAAPRQHCL